MRCDDCRPVIERGAITVGVVHPTTCVYRAAGIYNTARGIQFGDMSAGIVIKRIRPDVECIGSRTGIKVHVGIEIRFLCRWHVLPAKRCKSVRRVCKTPSHFIISQIKTKVIDKYIRFESDVAVYQPHFLAGVGIKTGNLVRAAVAQFIGIDKKCVTLLHADIAEGIHRFGFGEIMRAVAAHYHRAFCKNHITDKNHERVRRLFAQDIGSFKEYTVTGRTVGRRYGRSNFRTLAAVKCFGKQKRYKQKQDQAEKGLSRHSLTFRLSLSSRHE